MQSLKNINKKNNSFAYFPGDKENTNSELDNKIDNKSLKKYKRESEIQNRKFIDQIVKLNNHREEATRRALIESGILADYERKQYGLDNGKSYYPDFISNIHIRVNEKKKQIDKQIIFEPHTDFSKKYVEKYEEFSKKYKNFYIIFIIPKKNYDHLSENQINTLNSFSDIWSIENFTNKEEDIKKSKNQIKEKIRKLKNNQKLKAYLR